MNFDEKLERRTKSFKSKLSPSGNGCLEWTGCVDNYGYGVICRIGKITRTHRFAYFLEHGDIPDGMCVMHSCDNPKCCNPDHLSLGTHLDNNRDKCAKRRHAHGARNGRAKVSETGVVEIRNLYESGITQAEIAKTYGISQTGVSLIVLKKNWQHVL